MAKVSLLNRKRVSELGQGPNKVVLEKKDELLALKLEALNADAKVTGKLLDLSLEHLRSDPHQPRKVFKNIEALSQSIREQGVLQPILVKPKDKQGYYQIIVGERRFQAAQLAGLQTLPCIVREREDANTLILQLLENDQREQVSLLEEAHALSKLIDQMGLSKKDIAKELGREPAWISIRLGLLDAPKALKTLIMDGKVEDLRTLHELRKLHEEDPALFEEVVHKIRSADVVGSHRDLLRRVRASKKLHITPRILKVEYKNGRLFLFLEGKRKSVEFDVDPVVLKQLKGLSQ